MARNDNRYAPKSGNDHYSYRDSYTPANRPMANGHRAPAHPVAHRRREAPYGQDAVRSESCDASSLRPTPRAVHQGRDYRERPEQMRRRRAAVERSEQFDAPRRSSSERPRSDAYGEGRERAGTYRSRRDTAYRPDSTLEHPVRRPLARGGSKPRSPRGAGLPLPQMGGGLGGVSTQPVRPALDGGSRRRDTGVTTAIIGICVVAAIVIVGILMWTNRTVTITLNGSSTSMRVGTTIDQVIQEKGLAPTAGNLISVSGNKLQDGAGYPYIAKLGGNELDGAGTAAYRVADGDDLSIEDGRDRTEDYDVQVVDDQPQLEMGGDAWGNLSYISQWPKAGKYEMRTGKQSGETARGDTLQETQNAVVSIHQIKPTDGRKLVALTFDDGPAEKYTEAYLDILNRYGIHATFFNLGQSIEEYPDLAKKIVDQGSEVMSHTYQHQQLSKLDASALQSEFSNAFSMIKEKTGVDTTAFRPPYGDFKESTWLNSGGLASVSVLWNQDSLDWKRPGVDVIVKNSEKSVTSGSIILMHDGGGNRDQDVEALPRIIQDLQGQGYEFVTVTELMKSDNTIPEDIANGDAQMPDDSVWPTQIVQKDETSSSSTTTTAATTSSK